MTLHWVDNGHFMFGDNTIQPILDGNFKAASLNGCYRRENNFNIADNNTVVLDSNMF